MLDSAKHFAHLEKLIEMEEAAEIARFQQEFVNKTPEDRELTGMALLYMRAAEIHYSPAGHELITFCYASGKPLPVYSPDPGDVVSVSRDLNAFFEASVGTVYEKDKEKITVAFNRRLPEWMEEEGVYHLNISGARSTGRKMLETLRQVRSAEHSRLSFLRDASLGLKKTGSLDPVTPEKIRFCNLDLNDWQKKAVAMALSARDVALVHGPPGTGKTTVLVEIIRQVIEEEKFVFATAPSNTACDNLLECLVNAGIPAVRLGHPARIMEHLRKHTLDFKLAHHPAAKRVDQIETELDRLFARKDRHRDRRSLSRDEKNELNEDIRRLKEEVRELNDQIYQQVIQGASVMVGTHSSGSDPVLKSKPMDLLVMDEASQATEPSAWIPMLRAQKIIMAGDHFQLPPTVISREAGDLGLTRTLFERFHRLLPDEWKTLLRVQYRMNEKIMAFSSAEFYESKLIAHESVKSHTLADLSHVKKNKDTSEVFLFLDTAGRGFEEALEPGSESRFNRQEAELLTEHLNRLLEAGLKPEEIAVISPYSAQVRLLSSLMPSPGVEVDSVDGFQGREKEAVLVSLVRSNLEGEMGFLADTRRMNVAMTRARRKLLVIGDSATLEIFRFIRILCPMRNPLVPTAVPGKKYNFCPLF